MYMFSRVAHHSFQTARISRHRFHALLFTICAVFAALLIWGSPSAPAAESTPAPNRLTPEQMLGQMLMVGFRGADIERPTYDLTSMLEHIRQGHVGGVILFDYDAKSHTYGRNIESPQKLAQLTAALAAAVAPPLPPLFIAVDQEGGKVQRLRAANGFTDYPSHAQLGMRRIEATFETAAQIGAELAAHGINVNFAPCADVARGPSMGIGSLGRSFGSDEELVARYARAFTGGLEKNGIIAVLKHFPGHGSTALDSHEGLPDISATYSEADLYPYSMNRAAGMVMAGHLFNSRIDPEFPASLSAATIEMLLREQLGWQGVVITDDLQMRAISDRYSLETTIRLAVAAGNDILLFGNNLNYDLALVDRAYAVLVAMWKSGELPLERIERSYQRIARLKETL